MNKHTIQPEIITTADGSHSLYISSLDETYHSRHGALQESQYVFIQQGLEKIVSAGIVINVLEVGFGTGLNALLSAVYAQANQLEIHFHSLETFPLEAALMADYGDDITLGGHSVEVFRKLHDVAWNKMEHVTDFFHLKKEEVSVQDAVLEQKYDIIFYDAFGPRAQPDMWTPEIFEKLYKCLDPGGMLVTYCAKGQVRRDMQSVGFRMERLPGPPGKREMMCGFQ